MAKSANGSSLYQGPALGLFVSPNVFSVSPPGTLAVADNVFFSAPQVLEPRPGEPEWDNTSFGVAGDDEAKSVAFYNTFWTLVHYGPIGNDPDNPATSIAIRDTENPFNTFTDFTGSFTAAGPNRLRFVPAARSMFWNTDQGLYAWDGTGDPNGQPYLAGNPQGLSGTAVPVSPTVVSNGWMLGDSTVAYRYTICSKDAFGRVIEGPPSGRIILRNSVIAPAGHLTRSGSATVHVDTGSNPHYLLVGDSITLTPGEPSFPAGTYTVTTVISATQFNYNDSGSGTATSGVDEQFLITRPSSVMVQFPNAPALVSLSTDNFIRLYRSQMTSTADITPDDDLFLVYETPFLTSGQVTAGTLSISDITPEGFIAGGQAVALYTDPTFGQGILQANLQPPVAKDIVYWQDRLWFANTYGKHVLPLELIGVGSPDGLQVGDTIVIAGTTYTASSSPTATTPNFYVYSGGDPGTNIQTTAQNLVNAVNANTQQDVFAYYVSTDTGTPGQMLFSTRLFGDGLVFDVFSSRGTAFTPQLPSVVSPPYEVSSTNSTHAARVWYSKVGQPEAVPSVNYVQIDVDNNEILRIFPNQFQLLIFKTDGIYDLVNQGNGNFVVQKLSEFRLVAPDTVGSLNNQVYAYTDHGLIRISNGNVEQISTPIDDAIQKLTGPVSLPDFVSQAFGLAYPSRRQFLCSIIDQTVSDQGMPVFTSTNTQTYVYSNLNAGFTRYRLGAQCGVIVPPDNRDADTMILAYPGENFLRKENKTFTSADYYDNQVGGVLQNGTSGNTLLIKLNAGGTVEAGDNVVKDSDFFIVSDISGPDISGNLTVTVLGDPGWSSGDDVTVWNGFDTEITFNKITGGDPASLKFFQRANLLFKANTVYKIFAEFQSEILPTDQEALQISDSWGTISWGEKAWGAPVEQIYRITQLPNNIGECAQLTAGFKTHQALASYRFLGVAVTASSDTPENFG